MAGKDADRPAVGGQLFDIEQLQSLFGKNLFDGVEAQIRKMFVVDRVELVLFD